jgi:hypothetical protein
VKHPHRRPPPKINPARVVPIEVMITRAELARLDVIASQHRVSRWRVMRLALFLLFAEQDRAARLAAPPALRESAGSHPHEELAA